jgi:hypothetical protein
MNHVEPMEGTHVVPVDDIANQRVDKTKINYINHYYFEDEI